MENTVDSKSLWEAFSKDKQAARQTYGNQFLITGYASYVGPNHLGQPSIEITDCEGHECLIMCLLSGDDCEKRLSRIRKGCTIRVWGRLHGYMPMDDMLVIRECLVLD